MGAARLLPAKRGRQDRAGDVEHERQFEYRDPLGVERTAVILDGDVADARLQRGLLQKIGGGERIATLRDEMQATMERSAGIYRTGDALAKAVDALNALQ